MATRSTRTTGLDREVFDRAVDAILSRYVDRVDATPMLERGLKSMVGGLDTHSGFLTAGERQRLRARDRGGWSGLTVILRSQGKRRWLEVVAVDPRSPAARASIRVGDTIVAVDDQPMHTMFNQIEAEAAFAGAPSDVLELVVQPHEHHGTRTISLVLAEPEHQVVDGRLVETNGRAVALVTIRRFVTGTGTAVKREIDKIQQKLGVGGLDGVVLDVRGNPGGIVDEALVVADLFVAEGVLVRTRGRNGQILREERAHRAGTIGNVPLVVLQDRHTASAAELLAAALQDHQRATIIGERSYGKGTVQELMGLEDGSLLKLTVARYFSPKDQAIDGHGVAPDQHVLFVEGAAFDATRVRDDRGLTLALAALRGLPGRGTASSP